MDLILDQVGHVVLQSKSTKQCTDVLEVEKSIFHSDFLLAFGRFKVGMVSKALIYPAIWICKDFKVWVKDIAPGIHNSTVA